MNKPEILAPAGDFEKLKTAFLYGADACYMGMPSISMRVKENKMTNTDLEEILKLKNKLGKKIYLTMNIHAHENKLSFVDDEIKRLTSLHEKNLDPDGIIVSDAGIFSIVKEACPWLSFHISTQANILNSAAINFWVKQGVDRIILGREVSLTELKEIRKTLKNKNIKVELEGFVHGAMCMAYSGRCLLSSFMTTTQRDANAGMCAHTCRWKYKVHLEEEKRPGEYIPITEDENGSYIMSSKDMSMIEHLKELADTGLDSMKLEGRHKTIYYVALATRAYRQALDLAIEGKPPTNEIIELIESIDTRGYFTGFWYGKPTADGQNYKNRRNYNDKFCFAGVITKTDEDTITMEVRNKLNKNDKLDIITPTQNISFTLEDFQNAVNNEKIEQANPGQKFSITFKLPKNIMKNISENFIVRKRF